MDGRDGGFSAPSRGCADVVGIASAANHGVACAVYGEIERETEVGWLVSGHNSADSASSCSLSSQKVAGRISARRSGVCERGHGWGWFFVVRSSTAGRGNAPVGAQKLLGTRESMCARRLNSEVQRVDGWAFRCSDRAEFRRALTPPVNWKSGFAFSPSTFACP